MKVKIAGPDSAVVGTKTDFLVIPSEQVSYRWQVDGGIINGQDMPGITVEWTQEGPHHVGVLVTSHGGEVLKDEIVVNVSNDEGPKAVFQNSVPER
jgi:hypothetical protein